MASVKWENGLRYGIACFHKVTITAGELVIRPCKSDPVGVGIIARDRNCDSDLVETCNTTTGVSYLFSSNVGKGKASCGM